MPKQSPLRLDVIGDIHGQLEALEALLDDLGYRTEADGAIAHPEDRRLVFLGDLVDRGPHSFEVAERVRRACADQRHLCLLGNHEFNLVEWRRGRLGAKTSNRPTIMEIESSGRRWDQVLDFFETLPIALELDDLRITHAVWHRVFFDALAPALSKPQGDPGPGAPWSKLIRLHAPFMQGKLRGELPVDVPVGQHEPALQVFLKGHEIPAEAPFIDNDGRPRDKERARWWLTNGPEVPRDKRIIFGHYWNLPPIAGRHEDFCPPYSSGHPKLRDWAHLLHEQVDDLGTVSVPKSASAVCVDYNGVTNAGDRACVGAYRHPEAQVIWRTASMPDEPGP